MPLYKPHIRASVCFLALFDSGHSQHQLTASGHEGFQTGWDHGNVGNLIVGSGSGDMVWGVNMVLINTGRL